MVEYSQKWHNGTSKSRSIETSNELAAIQAQLNNLGREIKKVNEKVFVAQVGCWKSSHPLNLFTLPHLTKPIATLAILKNLIGYGTGQISKGLD
uniref:Uncharacterized protein n=1 Tax=Tanacetum cinerariifolium TaxID=118510 RepID=A0A6L2NIP7_TANCI|nr:hypothetical protein [Tanacetum cinerariifolium]